MKILGKYWKVLLAVILLAAAAYLYFDGYKTEEANYEAQKSQLQNIISALQTSIAENQRYAGIQDQLEGAKAELDTSRLELYQKFPVKMLEEDQIMYVLYLETLFGTEIFFEFGQIADLAPLSDGSMLQGLVITVNYEDTYEGFREMVDYLASDSRVASVYQSTIEYDAERDIVSGQITLLLYMMNTEAMDYAAPDVAVPDTGKENIFD